ncbi:hypothetical protein SLEP1_g54938 [Rubroshorea leprosula]|uniref:Transposase (putative) gypsy type domain-containing protein n=1 Tax=Rubroshorea leprosula TaxID=152421 RepID=A0AAV5MI09_9ROSI|nr:hypothetical protein SLEP1_g54938 [Rubroshorea leprosula]
MSSEEARSVVGSEVQPLDYGSMDTESSPSPTSSERTVEERMDHRVVEEVEEEEDEIPSSILEAGNRVDGCYDSDLDIVSEVRGYVSELGSRDSLRGLVGNCNLPPHVLIRPAGVNERACSAPRDHWMPIYLHYLIAGLRFPIPELLVGLLLDYSIGITQLTPNAMRVVIGFLVYCRVRGVGVPTMNMFKHFFIIKAGGRGEKGWYYFGPRSSSKENKNLFSAGPSSIKGWKEKFFFVDDTEWSRRDAEVEQLSAWKAKKTKQNNYKLNKDEVEEVEKLVREGDVVDILYLTSPMAIEAAELYGPSSLSEAEMNDFVSVAGGLRIPKKPRKKSTTSAAANRGVPEKERLPSTSARVLEIQQRLEPGGGASEEVSEEVAPLQRKKRKVAEPEVRGDEVTEFVPRPSAPEISLEVRERERAEVQGPNEGTELIPPHSYKKSLFEARNTTGAKHFLNATLPEVDKTRARDEAVSQLGATVVRHALESASWTNALAQEYAESVKDRASLLRQCEALRKEKEELQKEKRDLQKKNQQIQRRLDEVTPTVTELQSDNSVLSTKLSLEERKRKICEEKLEAQDKYIESLKKGAVELKKNVELLVHNGMEGHIGNFLNSNTFEGILKLYRLPTAILAFTDCRKKVKAQYPEVDVTTITFGEQEDGVEEDGESLCADFRPLIKLRWEHDVEGRTIFPPDFDAELVAVEEEGEGEEEEQGAGVEDQAVLAEVQPPEVHPVSSDEVQLPALPEAEVSPLPTGDAPSQPLLLAEEQPPPPAE